MFSIFTSHSFAAKKHKIYKKLPCNFNGVKVSTSARFHDGVKGGRCCPKCSGYKLKRGTSINMKRGTPIVAIADMKLISIYDISAHQKSKKKSESAGKKHGTDHFQSQKTMKPYDDIHLHFVDKKGNFILYYHFKETNLVKGFNQGNCKIPKEFQWGKKKFLPQDCGGYSEELIRNNFWVKKGQVIGLSGATGTSKGGPHISLGIAIPANEKIKKSVLEIIEELTLKDYMNIGKEDATTSGAKTTSDFIKSGLLNRTYHSSAVMFRYTAPQKVFKWENLPTDSDAYLFPVMSKKYLKKIGYYN
tara:strand:- start:228 stop:1136 length:909 start_codon:yes stop_codon:yes gene_type:complete